MIMEDGDLGTTLLNGFILNPNVRMTIITHLEEPTFVIPFFNEMVTSVEELHHLYCKEISKVEPIVISQILGNSLCIIRNSVCYSISEGIKDGNNNTIWFSHKISL